MSKEALFHETVATLYAATTDTGGFSGALECMSALTGSANSVFLYVPNGKQIATIEDGFHGLATDLVDRYNSAYNALDPAREIVLSMPMGSWYYDQRDLPSGFKARDPFYQEFFLPGGLRCMVATLAYDGPAVTGFFGQQRLTDQDLYEGDALRLLDALTPHLMRATALRMELAELRSRVAFLEDSLQQLNAGMLLCDGDGRVVFSNPAAEVALADPQHPLIIRAGQLMAKRDTGMLRVAINKARGGSSTGAATALCIDMASGSQLVWIVPVQAHTALAAPWQRPLALVWMRPPDQLADRPDFELFKTIYGLTAAEVRLATLLEQDLSPVECADALGVSIATVRTQLRALFAKCGCSRQSSLIRLLLTFKRPVRTSSSCQH